MLYSTLYFQFHHFLLGSRYIYSSRVWHYCNKHSIRCSIIQARNQADVGRSQSSTNLSALFGNFCRARNRNRRWMGIPISSLHDRFLVKICQMLKLIFITTTFRGPRKFLPCSTEWSYKNVSHSHHCELKIDPPMHPICKEFFSTVSHSKVQPEGPVIIEAEEGRINCPPRRPPSKDNGWCGSCSDDDLEEGACYPEKDRKWGFCSEQCVVPTLPSTLQELTLSVVEDRECLELLNHDKKSLVQIDIDKELCAGKKNYIPKIPVYTRIRNHDKKVSRVVSNHTFDAPHPGSFRWCLLREPTRRTWLQQSTTTYSEGKILAVETLAGLFGFGKSSVVNDIREQCKSESFQEAKVVRSLDRPEFTPESKRYWNG